MNIMLVEAIPTTIWKVNELVRQEQQQFHLIQDPETDVW
jgi:hypothetical protein